MSSLFDRLTINKLELRNRFVRSATMDSMADNGMVSEKEIVLYRALGQGDIGLIVSHGLYPTKEGQCSPRQLSAHANEAIPSLKRLVSTVHDNGGSIAAANPARRLDVQPGSDGAATGGAFPGGASALWGYHPSAFIGRDP